MTISEQLDEIASRLESTACSMDHSRADGTDVVAVVECVVQLRELRDLHAQQLASLHRAIAALS